jgi:hypothetical protein
MSIAPPESRAHAGTESAGHVLGRSQVLNKGWFFSGGYVGYPESGQEMYSATGGAAPLNGLYSILFLFNPVTALPGGNYFCKAQTAPAGQQAYPNTEDVVFYLGAEWTVIPTAAFNALTGSAFFQEGYFAYAPFGKNAFTMKWAAPAKAGKYFLDTEIGFAWQTPSGLVNGFTLGVPVPKNLLVSADGTQTIDCATISNTAIDTTVLFGRSTPFYPMTTFPNTELLSANDTFTYAAVLSGIPQ